MSIVHDLDISRESYVTVTTVVKDVC